MLVPLIVGFMISLTFIILSIKKPDLGRAFLGVFFIIMAIGVNGTITLSNIALNPTVFGLLLIVYEVIIGALTLQKGASVKIGLIGIIIFVVSITPVNVIQFSWLLLIVAPAYLLTKDFNVSISACISGKLL